LKPASHTHQQSRDIHQRLFEACCNRVYMMSWGSWQRDELCIWKAAQTALSDSLYPERLNGLLNDFLSMRNNALLYILGSRAVFICRNPARLHWNVHNELHSWDEPAMVFQDGSGWHFWRGLYLDAQWRNRHERFKLADIERESNVEACPHRTVRTGSIFE